MIYVLAADRADAAQMAGFHGWRPDDWTYVFQTWHLPREFGELDIVMRTARAAEHPNHVLLQTRVEMLEVLVG